ncbi:unnamed protein product [Sphagnum jensenii]|uniref:Uncharacterized protein n=1 Tax=Sphagnum jensenii TaxID=128206 RepID=A0ABP0WQU5_9BRYO
MSSGKAVNEAQRGTCSLTARGLPIQSSRAGTVYDISPQGTEKGLEVQYTMDHQVDAQMEVGEESNFNATEILTENTLKELFLVPAVREALALCHLRCVETGSYQIVKDKLHKLNFSTTALMGYVVGIANLQDHVNLTKDLKMSILGLRVLLPAARLKMPAGNLQKLIFHEILLLYKEHMCMSEAETTAVGFDNPDVKELMESWSLINNKFLQLCGVPLWALGD